MTTEPKMRRGWVYFVQGVDGGLVKIGFTTHMKGRLDALQMGSPVKLRVVGYVPGTIRDERNYHRDYAAHREHGEWFRPAEDIMRLAELFSSNCRILPFPSIPEIQRDKRLGPRKRLLKPGVVAPPPAHGGR